MQGQLAVGVVVRCHNQGLFLDEAISSLLTQTERPSEIVVVDDGSTDATSEVIRRLATEVPELRQIHRHPAKGPVASLNDGIEAVSTPLVCALDADDRLTPTYFQTTTGALANSPAAGLAYAGVRMFGAEKGELPVRAWSIDRLLVENFVPISAVMRRSMYDELGPFDSAYDAVGFEDWEFWVRAASRGGSGSRLRVAGLSTVAMSPGRATPWVTAVASPPAASSGGSTGHWCDPGTSSVLRSWSPVDGWERAGEREPVE